MAEILLSLTIIGVVAAITLPSLTGNINERTWNTQRKALYARISQAISLMPSLNGYGTLVEGDDSNSAVDTAAETFITAGLAKVLKINNICDSEHLSDCGLSEKIQPMSASSAIQLESIKTLKTFNVQFARSDKYRVLDTKAIAFETVNGESILAYYNPTCFKSVLSENNTLNYDYCFKRMCLNFIYDLNGTKGPNTVGKDIGFITVFEPTDSIVVAPMPYSKKTQPVDQFTAGSACKEIDSAARIPNLDEVIAMDINQGIIGKIFPTDTWAGGAVIDKTKAWAHGYGYGANYVGTTYAALRTTKLPVVCIKR